MRYVSTLHEIRIDQKLRIDDGRGASKERQRNRDGPERDTLNLKLVACEHLTKRPRSLLRGAAPRKGVFIQFDMYLLWGYIVCLEAARAAACCPPTTVFRL